MFPFPPPPPFGHFSPPPGAPHLPGSPLPPGAPPMYDFGPPMMAPPCTSCGQNSPSSIIQHHQIPPMMSPNEMPPMAFPYLMPPSQPAEHRKKRSKRANLNNIGFSAVAQAAQIPSPYNQCPNGICGLTPPGNMAIPSPYNQCPDGTCGLTPPGNMAIPSPYNQCPDGRCGITPPRKTKQEQPFTEKLINFYEKLKAADDDGDGKVTQSDLIKVLGDSKLGLLAPIVGKKIFETLDKDNDGKLTLKDGLLFIQRLQSKTKKQ